MFTFRMSSGKFLAAATAALITVAAGAQSVLVPRALSGMDGIESAQSRIFTETSLYGYINGGAELYLEYGFDTLLVTELVVEGSDIKAEVYRMKDPEAAFGIFSVSRFRCNGGAKLTEHLCRSAYQLQFCKGPFYISIINDTGSDDDQKRSSDLARLMIDNIEEPSFDPGSFYNEALDEDTMRGAVLVRGPLGIYNGIPGLSEQLARASGYSALLIRLGTDTIASMKFNSDLAAEQFLHDSKILPGSGKSAVCSDSTVSVVSPRHIIITF
jgi:hypothetical protein